MPEPVTKSKSIVGIKRNDKIKDKVKPNKLRKVDNSKIIASEKIESKTDNKILNGSSVENRSKVSRTIPSTSEDLVCPASETRSNLPIYLFD